MENEELWLQMISMKTNNTPTSKIHKLYKDKTGSKCSEESFARLLRKKQHEKPKEKKIVGVIGDFHAPFNHKDYLKFCQETFEKWGVNEVVMIGDLVDNHAISRHQTETDALGGWSEFSMAKYEIEKMKIAFPKLKLCLGNHDRIPERQAATLGLHEGFIKSFSDMWNLPDEWEVAPSFIMDNVLYTHGLASGGKNGTLNYAIKKQMSVVLGHKHGCSGVRYYTNGDTIIFGMDSGCGVCAGSYAMRYGKEFPDKPVLSCGIVINDKEGYTIPMITK